MPVYAYKGLNQGGRNVSGIIDADTAKGARRFDHLNPGTQETLIR